MEHHLELDFLGILRQTKIPPEWAWLIDVEKQFLLELLLAGEGGLHRSKVAKFEKNHPDALLNLTVRNLCEWETDRLGKPASMVLTWKGEDLARLLLQIAKNESKKTGNHH